MKDEEVILALDSGQPEKPERARALDAGSSLRITDATPPSNGKGNGLSAQAFDAFVNAAARMGYGTRSLPEASDYPLVRLSNNYWLLISLYRNHWLSRRIIDTPPQDMVRAWPKITSDIPPKDLKDFDRTIDQTATKDRLLTAMQWGRLFGGAGALIVIKGHEKRLAEPLSLDDINPGSYRGLIPFDRWSGITPRMDVSTDLEHPRNFGLPESYDVRVEQGDTFEVHHTRILRFVGPTVPIPEYQAQMRWGISVIEIVFEELRKRDNMSWTILNLLFRAQILAQVNPELAQMLSGATVNAATLQKFLQIMEAQNDLLSNQSMLIMGKDSSLEAHQYSFGGVADIYAQFQMDIAGAAEIPVARLFGRTISGLNQTNDADERIYEEKVAQWQQTAMRPQLMQLYPIICMSEFGEVPDDLDIAFPSVRVLTEEEKAELAKDSSAAVVETYNADLLTKKQALMELKQQSDKTGLFTNITDKDIRQAPDEYASEGDQQMMGSGGLLGSGMKGFGQPRVGGVSGKPGAKLAPKLVPPGKGKAAASPKAPVKAKGKDAAFEGSELEAATDPELVRALDAEREPAYSTQFQGLDIGIENPVGSTRFGIADDGSAWRVKFQHPYGYIKNTVGADGDAIDCFIGPDPESHQVFVVHQNNLAGEYDEDKVMLGYGNQAEAEDAYFAHYDRPSLFFRSTTPMSMDEFKGAIAERAQATDAEPLPPGGHWVTINGTHVYIDKAGYIKKGPSSMVGKHEDVVRGKYKAKPSNPIAEIAAKGKLAREGGVKPKKGTKTRHEIAMKAVAHRRKKATAEWKEIAARAVAKRRANLAAKAGKVDWGKKAIPGHPMYLADVRLRGYKMNGKWYVELRPTEEPNHFQLMNNPAIVKEWENGPLLEKKPDTAAWKAANPEKKAPAPKKVNLQVYQSPPESSESAQTTVKGKFSKPVVAAPGIKGFTPSPAHTPSAEKVEQEIHTTPIVGETHLGGGCNVTKKLYLANGHYAVWKPSSGEDEGIRRNIATGWQAEREAAAWEVAKLVGMDDLATPCYVARLNGQKGSIMAWNAGAHIAASEYSNMYDGEENVARAAAFDWVIGNEDRHAGNWMIDKHGDMHLIDHGCCFPDQAPYSMYNASIMNHARQEFAGKPSHSPDLYAAAYEENIDKIADVMQHLGLSPNAIAGVKHRIGILAKAKSWDDITQEPNDKGVYAKTVESRSPGEEESSKAEAEPEHKADDPWEQEHPYTLRPSESESEREPSTQIAGSKWSERSPIEQREKGRRLGPATGRYNKVRGMIRTALGWEKPEPAAEPEPAHKDPNQESFPHETANPNLQHQESFPEGPAEIEKALREPEDEK